MIWRERMNRLIKEHGDFVISNVTVAQICSGIRGVPIQISDISYVEPEYGLPCMGIEKDYVNTSTGQLRTRFQAFVEALEIKRIQQGKEA